MGEIGVILILGTMFLVPVVLLVLDFVFFVQKKERPIFEIVAFFVGSVYMALAFMIWDLPDYQTAINIYGTSNVHEPISSQHMLAVFIFAVWGFLSYFILKFGRKKLPPLVEVLLLGGVYVGCGLSAVWIFQLICGGHPEDMPAGVLTESSVAVSIHMEMFDLIMILCLCVVPILYIMHSVQMLHCLIKEKAQRQEVVQYEQPFMQKINQWFLKGTNLFWGAVIAMLPILGILVMLLVLFGQQPDSIILAFTQTSDWILSKEIAPPPVAHDMHYLCTVSLRGHRRLVKPIRYGIRRDEKIVVNRQLCVANAFEQLLMEKTPRFHKQVRQFYDTYGYPVSRHINNAWSADITYIIMKPLEWIFLMVLYLFDSKPENRIASQYLPCGWQEQVSLN